MRTPAAAPVVRAGAASTKPFVLGFVSTGIGKSAVARRLEQETGAKVVDVSRVLCGLTVTQDALAGLGWRAPDLGDPTPRLIDIMMKLPRPRVLELWENALGHAMSALAYGDRTQTRVLLVGNMYHSPRRSEYYSPFSLPRLRECGKEHGMIPGRVVMFIDDVYDMYSRLAGPNDVFAPLKSIALERARILSIDQVKLEEMPLADQALVATEVRAAHLVKLLHWRQLELTQAERTARSLRVPYLLWAIKQDVKAITPWLAAKERAVTYVSHPISRPRRDHSQTGTWSAIVAECNALPSQLASLNTTSVMPTAIDEFRLARGLPLDHQNPSRLRRRPTLMERWPLVDGTTLYEPGSASAPEHLDLLAPHRLVQMPHEEDKVEPVLLSDDDAARLDPVLRALESQIEAQVSARDHTIVVNTAHTVVFRPFYGEPVVSRGVQSEIEHWQDLCMGDAGRRIAFLHRVSDVGTLIQKQATADECRRYAIEVIEYREHVSGQRATELYEEATKGQSQFNMLDLPVASASGDAQRSRVLTYLRECPLLLLRQVLAWYDPLVQTDLPSECVGLWVIPDEIPWPSVLPEVVAFLADGTAPPDSALQSALSLMPR